jgi:hypothetical protein
MAATSQLVYSFLYLCPSNLAWSRSADFPRHKSPLAGAGAVGGEGGDNKSLAKAAAPVAEAGGIPAWLTCVIVLAASLVILSGRSQAVAVDAPLPRPPCPAAEAPVVL